jgi:hypothetical protein
MSRLNTCNIRLKQMKHFEPILETYVYSHCNMCNIPIYFCNIDVKHLQHTSETSETLETYACNLRFPAQYHIAAWTKEAHRCEAQRRCGDWRRCMELIGAPAEALQWASTHARPREQRWVSTCTRSNWRARRPARANIPCSTASEQPATDKHPYLASTNTTSYANS